ncbi:MAG TPA: ribosome biogenesis factor YjgA [Pseudomonadales bacterium]
MTADAFEDEIKSKSQAKREMQDLQALGEKLLHMPDSAYRKIPVPDALDKVIAEARRIKSNSALRRHLQLIGKIMRQIDADPIRTAIDNWENGNRHEARHHQQLEQLRDALVEQQPGVLQQLIDEHPGCDIQQLRQLVRLACQEQQAGSGRKHYRKLFQFLKDLPDNSN